MEKLTGKPKTMKELAAAYSVSKKTFKNWLQYPPLDSLRKNGYYFSINQVEEIVKHLGEP
ncbi:MAG: DUF4248 domain-containing protein [Prevotellaceae bacterium]|jgi:hypothetical protein|nr:DUF4248 domain-containing protein [Prevotellaceae bacterium]